MNTATKMRANSVIATSLAPDASAVTWTVKGAMPDGSDGTLTLRFADIADANRERAMIHGFGQRIKDAAAQSADTKTGKSAPPSEKFAAMKRLVDHYSSGAEGWSPERDASGPGLDSLLLAAVAEALGKTVDDVRTLVASGAEKAGCKPSEYLAAASSSAKAAPIVARMRGERAGVSGDDILADMA